jgi:hypothetical protein
MNVSNARKGVNQVAAQFRAKTYANRHAEAKDKPNKLQVSGDIAAFNKLAKGDKATVEEFNQIVSSALKA